MNTELCELLERLSALQYINIIGFNCEDPIMIYLDTLVTGIKTREAAKLKKLIDENAETNGIVTRDIESLHEMKDSYKRIIRNKRKEEKERQKEEIAEYIRKFIDDFKTKYDDANTFEYGKIVSKLQFNINNIR
jgi:Mg2+ and Co2+ transporter CorA